MSRAGWGGEADSAGNGPVANPWIFGAGVRCRLVLRAGKEQGNHHFVKCCWAGIHSELKTSVTT